jgi:hypothetical protein
MKSVRYTVADGTGAGGSLIRDLTRKRPLENPRRREENGMKMGHT